MMKYFKVSFMFTIVGMAIAAWIGYEAGGVKGLAQTVFITLVLAVLEVSLSFDNAIVNAIILKDMTPLWRQRFLTWGIAIAVFGMRLVFPVVLVSVIAKIDPLSALKLAIFDPNGYAERMLSAHLDVAAYGGSFLLLVGFKYFLDAEKENHWIHIIEGPLTKLGRLTSVEIALCLLCLLGVMSFLPEQDSFRFLKAGLWGVVTFVAVDGMGTWMEFSGQQKSDINRASAGLFIYLEVLDASFSFDGVIGAFAITQNLFIIMIGLSIGAFFVRSLTILFVEKNILSQFAFLEHGAFYAILSLAVIMLLDPFLHVPEWVTGLLGAVIIAVSFLWSVRFAPASKSSTS